MEQKNVQAIFQLQDSYVKDFSIKTSKKIDSKENLNIIGQLGFRIINISENKDNLIGQIELINDIKLNVKEEERTVIHISMIGLFVNDKKQDKNKFEEMLKLNGASTLSHLIRAYIYSITGLSGIPAIVTPMVNFVEFFKNAEEQESKADTGLQ